MTIQPGTDAPVNTTDAPTDITTEPNPLILRILNQDRPAINAETPMQDNEPANQPADTDSSADPTAEDAAPAPIPTDSPDAIENRNGTTQALRPCPYCGHLGENDGAQEQCSRCKGWFEPLSKQASQNSMGPWFFHDDAVPFRPGCSYQTLRKLIVKQRVSVDTIIRGPGTNQFWAYARHAPGVAHLLGLCHNCGRDADENEFLCEYCGASFPTFKDRQHLGLAAVRLLPGQANPSHVAASALNPDPDESNYGPVAPTFASAAVEAATAKAEAATLAQPRSNETIDETPGIAAAPEIDWRRERRHGRLKMTVGALMLVIIALLIAVGALLMRPASPSVVDAETPAPIEAAPEAAPEATQAQQEADAWADRLVQAQVLIATNDPAQMESALTILKDAEANAPATSIPADLHERIDRLTEAIDAAKLRNYLNKNN